jgi:hypothetical protein
MNWIQTGLVITVASIWVTKLSFIMLHHMCNIGACSSVHATEPSNNTTHNNHNKDINVCWLIIQSTVAGPCVTLGYAKHSPSTSPVMSLCHGIWNHKRHMRHQLKYEGRPEHRNVNGSQAYRTIDLWWLLTLGNGTSRNQKMTLFIIYNVMASNIMLHRETFVLLPNAYIV